MERKLDVLLGHAGAGTPAVAACAGSAITDAGIQVLASRHVKLHKVSGTKDAADKNCERRRLAVPARAASCSLSLLTTAVSGRSPTWAGWRSSSGILPTRS